MIPEASAADLAACDAALRAGSKSFAAAARLLPSRVRAPATALYAFCRSADDAVDDGGDALSAVDALRTRLARAYEDRALDGPVDRAFAWVVRAFALPRALPEALVEGMEWDARGRRYETLDDLEAYCARVASSVGAMMAVLMGARSADALARACDLGVAMQLTNVARDVAEDAGRGRVYLPRVWLREAAFPVNALFAAAATGRPVWGDARLRAVVERLLARADELYARADAGIALLPRDCRVAIRAARLIYADIGRSIARAGYDVSSRAYVTTRRKLWLVLRAWLARRAPACDAPPLEATRFLVAAGAP